MFKVFKYFYSIGLAIIILINFTAGLTVSADASDSFETVSDNLLENPDWTENTQGWDITVNNEYEDIDGITLIHSVISQDVQLDDEMLWADVSDENIESGQKADQGQMLCLSGYIAVASDDITQEYIELELSFFEENGKQILIQETNVESDTGSGNHVSEGIVYENSPELTYHEIILDIPDDAAFARVSLGIWKNSKLNLINFDELTLKAVKKTAQNPFYRSAGQDSSNGFHRSAGTDNDIRTQQVSDEWDPQIIAEYEALAQQAAEKNERPYASDLPEYGDPEIVYITGDGKASASSGVVVDFSDSLDIGGDPFLVVSETPEVTDSQLGASYKSYNITLADVHELDGYIEIRLPYDISGIDEGQDPARCVAGMYLNDETQQWESVLYDVDEESRELVIHTDHLSEYGCFKFANEGLRSARVISINDYMMDDDPLQCSAAIREIMDSKGVPGIECRKVMKPYLDSFLRSYYEASVSNTADLATKTGNISGMLITAVPGAQAAIDKNPLAYGLNQALGKAGLAISIISLAAQMTREDKTDNEILSMYKDAAYLLASISGEAALGTIAASVWVIDYAVTDMGNFVYSKVKENLTKAYRFYMTTNNRWHGKPRTMKEWRRILKQIAKTAIKDNSDAQNAIMKEIDDYCTAFWKMRDDDLAEVYDEVGLGGHGLPDAATKEAITNEFKGEMMDSLQSVIKAVQNDLEYELMEEQEKRLEEVRKILNTVITVEIRDNHEKDQKTHEKDQKSVYAGYTAAFAALDKTAVHEDWCLTLDSNGCSDIKITYISWLLAGQPTEIELYHPGQKAGEDKPEKTVSFNLTVPVTIVNIADGYNIDAYLGKWRYVTQETAEYGSDSYSKTTTEIMEFILDGDILTVIYHVPLVKTEGETPGMYTYYIDYLNASETIMTGTYSFDETTGDLLHHIHSATKGRETITVEHTMVYHLADENHLAEKDFGQEEYNTEILEKTE